MKGKRKPDYGKLVDLLTKAAKITHPLTIKSSGEEKPIILFERMMALEIQNGGSLAIENIKFGTLFYGGGQ